MQLEEGSWLGGSSVVYFPVGEGTTALSNWKTSEEEKFKFVPLLWSRAITDYSTLSMHVFWTWRPEALLAPILTLRLPWRQLSTWTPPLQSECWQWMVRAPASGNVHKAIGCHLWGCRVSPCNYSTSGVPEYGDYKVLLFRSWRCLYHRNYGMNQAEFLGYL